jgi:hypothetical protein
MATPPRQPNVRTDFQKAEDAGRIGKKPGEGSRFPNRPPSPGGINNNKLLWKLGAHGNIPRPQNNPPTSPYSWNTVKGMSWLNNNLLKNRKSKLKPIKKNGSLIINRNPNAVRAINFNNNTRKTRKSKTRKSKRRGTRKN